uniref:G-protein coupled receptors family 1 profile domain-containing protein n=1 Tax=Romanomermis culicivorax TaxID=13658 RepID=A0A915I1U7_ROMCU
MDSFSMDRITGTARYCVVKYYYICQYRQYLKYFTSTRISIYSLLIWLVSFSIHIPNHVGWGSVRFSAHFQFCTFDSHHHTYPFLYASTIAAAIVLTAIFYTKLYCRIRKTNLPRQLILGLKRKKSVDDCSSFQPIRRNVQSTTVLVAGEYPRYPKSMLVFNCERNSLTINPLAQRKKVADELRLIKASFKIFLLFLIMWFPVVVVILFFRDQSRWNVPESVYLFTALIAHSNSTCNVFIYYYDNCSFRKFHSKVILRENALPLPTSMCLSAAF